MLGHYAREGDATLLILFSILPVTAMIAALYGCPHLLGLHIRFPTPAEHTLWLVSTILVISCPTLAVLTFCIAGWVGENDRAIIAGCFTLCFVGSLLIYPIASIFLVYESVRQVFALPDAAFRQPQWTQYIPHFS